MNMLTSYTELILETLTLVYLAGKKKKKTTKQKIQPRLLILFQEKILFSFAMFTLFHLNPHKNYWEKTEQLITNSKENTQSL